MVVDPADSRHVNEEFIDHCADASGRHARFEFLRLGLIFAYGLHWKMEHHFTAAAVRLVGNLYRLRMLRQNGNGHGVGQSEDLFSGGAIAAEIVNQNREFGFS